MNDFIGNHAPTPEFRASLEREIVSTFRRETQFAPPARSGRGGRMHTMAALAVGLIVGVGTAFTSTRVADARQREVIASTSEVKRELATVQLALMRANYDQVRSAFERGAITRASRLTAEAELHASEARVARIELDLAESRMTAAPPRDELWSPLVGERDFVTERLRIEATAAQQRLTSLEATAADAERGFRSGILTRAAMAEAQSEVLQAKRDADAVARRLSLRKQFLDEHLAPKDVARRLQRFELMTDVERAEQLLRLAQQRLTVARERSGLGETVNAKAKQAQVAVLEHSLEIDQLRLESARTALTYRAVEQQGIPTIDLPAASARSSEPLRSVLGVRQLPGGNVLVNDAGSRQIRLFDSTLASSIVTLDSTPGVANSYGPRDSKIEGFTSRAAKVALSLYLGDSSLLPDNASRTIRVLDGRGQVARTVTLPNTAIDLSSPGYVDDKGRLLFSGLVGWNVAPGGMADSVPIVRFDIASRRVDTVARVKYGDARWLTTRRDSAWAWRPYETFPAYQTVQMKATTGYSPARDEWAVLSNGSIAMVRGMDYHVDWIHPDGTMSSTPKLPFDWPQLGTANNQDPVDSARAAQRRTGVIADTLMRKLFTTRFNLSVLRFKLGNAVFPVQPFGAAIADLDGNLWILPTGSPSSYSQPVYDVVNAKGELFLRVRMPMGRSIAGFGKGGVVYLVADDGARGSYLERTQLKGQWQVHYKFGQIF